VNEIDKANREYTNLRQGWRIGYKSKVQNITNHENIGG